MQGVANDPASIPARQALLGESGTLVDRFHALDRRLTELNSRINADLKSAVTEVNNLATSIASLNQEIARAQGSGQTPNDLLDQRDNLIGQLAERVSVTTVAQSDGSVNVFAGNGQTLVAGFQSMALSVTPNVYDPTRSDIGYTIGSTTVNVTSQITGGTLGGALDFRSQVLDTARAALGARGGGARQDLQRSAPARHGSQRRHGWEFLHRADAGRGACVHQQRRLGQRRGHQRLRPASQRLSPALRRVRTPIP